MYSLKKDKRIALKANDDKRIQSFDSIAYTYGTTKETVYKIEKNKCNNIIKQYKK